MSPPQIVLDTNVLVAGLRSTKGASYKLLSLIDSGVFEINLSVPLVVEHEDVLMRLQPDLGMSKTDIADFLDYLCTKATLHEIYFLWRPFLSDPRDEMVLELAVKARCSYIVTYNKRDFRGAETFGLEVVTSKEFLDQINV